MNRFMAALGAAAAFSASALIGVTAPASADEPKKPYPDTSRYAKVDFEGFQIDGKPGLWFSTPTGLNCGIWDDGSIGCTGAIPGAPAGTNQIGAFGGDSEAHFDNTDQPRFTAGGPQKVLAPNTYISYKGSTCATTPDHGVYCTGQYYGAKFLVTATASWLGPQT